MDTPQKWREWLRGFTREPKDRVALALSAVDAFETLLARPPDETAAVQTIAQAAKSPYKLVFETGCHILFHLATTLSSCRDAIDRMASASNSISRFHAIAYLHQSLPEPLMRSIIQRALSDPSGKTRAKAVERIEEFQLHEYVPQLAAMLNTEKDATVLASLDLHLPLLKDGFHLSPQPDGTGYWLSVRGAESRASSSRRPLKTSWVRSEDYSAAHLPELLEWLRKRP